MFWIAFNLACGYYNFVAFIERYNAKPTGDTTFFLLFHAFMVIWCVWDIFVELAERGSE